MSYVIWRRTVVARSSAYPRAGVTAWAPLPGRYPSAAKAVVAWADLPEREHWAEYEYLTLPDDESPTGGRCMSAEPIRTKRQMYALLAAGRLGNTVPQWMTLADWLATPDRGRYPLWGIRSGVAGGDRRMRLNVPTADVTGLYASWYGAAGGNISPMIDAHAVLRAEVVEYPHDLCLRYVPPGKVVPGDPWRGSFREYGREVTGSAARAVLSRYLWPQDYEDARGLLEAYPDHVVEFTACDRAVGVVPLRNTVVWEVRRY